MHAIGIAKVQEEKYLDLRRFARFPVTKSYSTNASLLILQLLPLPNNPYYSNQKAHYQLRD